MQRPVSSIRSLLAGFGGLLVLMGCLAVDSARQTHDVSMASTALRQESRTRGALLDQLRTDTYRSATLVRDYMLEHDDIVAASQKAELQLLRTRVEQSLNRYGEYAPQKEKVAVKACSNVPNRTGLHWRPHWIGIASRGGNKVRCISGTRSFPGVTRWFNSLNRSMLSMRACWMPPKSGFK
jgi:hypothetical protein